MDKEEEEESEAAKVSVFVRKQVPDWDDSSKSRARFKALSGQRSDWDPLYLFWKDLILQVSSHLTTFILRPSIVKRSWFTSRDGLSPLCLDQVLLQMHRDGYLISPLSSSPSARPSLLSNIFRKAIDLLGTSGGDSVALTEDYYVLAPLLEERAREVVRSLSESYWTSSCVVTVRKFEEVCGGSVEAVEVLGYLSARGRAAHVSVKRDDLIEGVKVRLAPGAVCSASSNDSSVLHLTWTAEKLEKQLQLIDQQHQKIRNSALASIKSGNKKSALRFAKELKLVSLSRERSTALLDRVENVLQVITDAESSKKVFEALKDGTHAMKENQVSVEEVELCLLEVDENIDSLRQLDSILESNTAYGDVDDENIEDEFNKLQSEIQRETTTTNVPAETKSSGEAEEASEKTDALSNALSNLNLEDGAVVDSKTKSQREAVGHGSASKVRILEAA